MHPRRALTAVVGALALLIAVPAAHAAPGSLIRLGQATGAGGLRAVAVSADGRNVYAVAQAESRLTAYRREPTGVLTPVDVEADSLGGVTTLGGALSVAVSPDGLDVYVAAGGDAAVTGFTRNPATGELTLQGCVNETGAGGCDAGSGLAGAEGVAVSPDGASVYVTGPSDMALNVLSRSSTSGDLTYTGCFKDIGAPESCTLGTVQGLAGANQVAVAPDGRNVYVTGKTDDAVVNFQRAPSGTLTPRNCVSDTGGLCNSATQGLDGVRGLAVSADGANVYAAGQNDDALVAFTRDPIAGDLIPLDLEQHGVGGVAGLNGPEGLAAAPDGATVYVGSVDSEALAAFTRDATGRLTFLECFKDGAAGSGCGGAEGLDDANAIAVPADGAHVYVSSRGDASVTVFSRETPPAPPTGGPPSGDPGSGGGPTGAGSTPTPAPSPKPPDRPLICVGLWTSFCAGFPPPDPVQTCVSLWQNCNGFGGRPPAGPGTIDLSGLPTSVTTRAGCDERAGRNPFTSRPRTAKAAQSTGSGGRDATTCLIQIHLEGTDPNSDADVAYATLVRQFNAEVDQIKGEHVQGVIVSCAGVDLNCQRANEALPLFLAKVVEDAFEAAKAPGKPVQVVGFDLQRAEALCGTTSNANCMELFRNLNASLQNHLRFLRSRKAELGLDKPRAATPRSVAVSVAARRPRVVIGSGTGRLRQGKAGTVRLKFSPQARQILRTARRHGKRSLTLTAVTRATIVPGVTATKRVKVKVLLRRR